MYRLEQVTGGGPAEYWWMGQRERSEGVFVNVDDPPSDICPGVYLEWQKSDVERQNQPNGNEDNQEDQDCIILIEKDEGVAVTGTDSQPFQDKACYWRDGYQTFCKHTTCK